MPLIDHTNTFALLIGVSSFPNDPTIDPIPNILSNIKHLKECFINHELVGIPESNITISIDEDKRQIQRRLRDIREKTRNRKFTLLIYYSGHGILSSEDFQLYLATRDTSKNYLEDDSIKIGDFRESIKNSIAGRKIVILDCCHSGAIIGTMGDMSSKIQAELNGFEGTYIMTSAAEDTPSLFPEDCPEQPTFFTGELLNIINEGIDIDKEFFSLRDIYNQINDDFRLKGLPPPQQSSFNNTDQLNIAKNKKFKLKKPADEVAWEEVSDKTDKWAFIDFRKQFPDSPFAKEAKKKFYEIEENESWNKALDRNTVGALYNYLDNYPEGRYLTEANQKIRELREKDERKRREAELQEENAWNEALKGHDIPSLQEYLNVYPFGRFSAKAKESIEILEEEEQQRILKRKEAEEENRWEKANEENSIEAFEEYLCLYPSGKFSDDAQSRIDTINEIEIQKFRKENEEKERDRLWNETVKENTITSYETYLKTYPADLYSNKAKEKILFFKEEEKQRLEREKAAKEETFWEQAKKINLKDSYNEYLRIYPHGIYSNEANDKIDFLNKIEQEKQERQRLWNVAIEKNTISSYEKFLRIYKDGKFFQEAKNNIQILKEIENQKIEKERVKEEQFWEKIKRKNSVESYSEYLRVYPSGKFTSDANNQIHFLKETEIEKGLQEQEERERLWNKTAKENSVFSYETFLTTYPDGRFSEEAKNRILLIKKEEKLKLEREKEIEVEEQQFWEKTKYESSINSFKEYLRRYPSGKFIDQAKDQIETLDKTEVEKIQKKQEERERQIFWNKAADKNTISSYQQYLKRYPEGRFSEEANNNIQLLYEKEKHEREQNKNEENENIRNEDKMKNDGDNNTSLNKTAKNKWILASTGLILLSGLIAFVLISRKASSLPVPDVNLQARVDIINAIYNNLVEVNGGTFTMGLKNSEYESPAHPVTVRSFLFSKYEVTRAQWNAIMGDEKFKSSFNLPATNINWIEANDFINKLNSLSGNKYRLPTESEWEYTCLKGYENKPKGNENDYSWNINNSNGILHPVGEKLPDNYGLYDMLGNAYEWCSDTYSRYNSNPSDTDIKVIRGGDYKVRFEFISSKIRNMEKSAKSREGIGFRLALDL